jgi:hypothetical protein
MRKQAVLVLTAALLVIGSPAQADKASFRDGNDTKGRLDMKRFTHGHAGGGRVVHTVRMFRRVFLPLIEGSVPPEKATKAEHCLVLLRHRQGQQG